MRTTVENNFIRNPFLGMSLSFLSGIGAQTSTPMLSGGTREVLFQLISDIGIVVGFLIGLLTLALKIKEFANKYLSDEDKKGTRKK